MCAVRRVAASQDIIGRPCKVGYATGDVQPGGGGKANTKKGSFVDAPLSAKPAGCTCVFIGNLSFAVKDEDVMELFKSCGEITDVRAPARDLPATATADIDCCASLACLAHVPLVVRRFDGWKRMATLRAAASSSLPTKKGPKRLPSSMAKRRVTRSIIACSVCSGLICVCLPQFLGRRMRVDYVAPKTA